MKRLFLLIVVAVLTVFKVSAQNSYSDIQKKFLFVYIAHDNQTSVENLCTKLRVYYEESVIYQGNVAVFYLANESNPMIVEINTPDDNRDDFEKMISMIQNNNSHPVYPINDLQQILKLFEKLKLTRDDGLSLQYETVDWFFYVTSNFWDRNYNEELVAKLCFVMGTENFDKYNFQMKFYHPDYDEFKVDEKYPFGLKNYADINNAFYYYSY